MKLMLNVTLLNIYCHIPCMQILQVVLILFTSVNMSSSWVMMATYFHSKYCISLTIPGAMLMSEATGRRKVGKFAWLDSLGDVEVVDICMKTYHVNIYYMFIAGNITPNQTTALQECWAFWGGGHWARLTRNQWSSPPQHHPKQNGTATATVSPMLGLSSVTYWWTMGWLTVSTTSASTLWFNKDIMWIVQLWEWTCASPAPGSRMVLGWPLVELPLSSLPQWWECQSH